MILKKSQDLLVFLMKMVFIIHLPKNSPITFGTTCIMKVKVQLKIL